MLPRSDWLSIAERLPVGRSHRIVHSCGRGTALSVSNTETAYKAWCHRCQLGGYVSKEHVQYRPVVQEGTRTTLPSDAVPFVSTSKSVQEHAYRFFIGKGIDPNMLPLHDMLWHKATHRVIFKYPQGAAGRVLQDDVFPKWVQYYVNGRVGSHASFGKEDAEQVVFTEDILSAIKYSYSTGCLGIALLGTVLAGDVQLRSNKDYIIALDGDAAGRAGARCTHRRLLFRGIEATRVQTPVGKDPKDLTIRELRESLL